MDCLQGGNLSEPPDEGKVASKKKTHLEKWSVVQEKMYVF